MRATQVRLLRPDDDRTTFNSGDLRLDRFFREHAGQNQFREHIGATYVAVDSGRILGFVTVSAAHIEIDDLPLARRRKLPRYPLPVLRLARLAVDQSSRSIGIGKLLLLAVFEIAAQMAQSVGCLGVVVDAKPEAAVYYERFGFEPLDVLEGVLGGDPQPLPMFLSLGSIPKALP